MNIFSRRTNIAVTISLFFAVLLLSEQTQAQLKINFPTYFHYDTPSLVSLKKLTSPTTMTVNQLQKWDAIMFNLVKENKLAGIPAARIYAYVYTAQRDAAFLSMNLKRKFMGSLEPVSGKTLCLFFANNCKNLEKQFPNDAYSNQLGDIVLEKIKLRIELDKKQSRLYPTKKGKEYWSGKVPYVGQDLGSAKTWLISEPNAFLSKPPPAPESKEWQYQLKATKRALKNITPEQIKSIHYWAGNPSTISAAGIWLDHANKYMNTQQTPLAKRVLVRSVLAMGIFDSFISIFHAKYTYWVKRPNMLDPSLKPILTTPNHPSYPAGHASLSAAAATILSYYFPENKQRWWSMVDESSQGRVIGGIHFPIDIKHGIILGKNVGKAALYNALHRPQS